MTQPDFEKTASELVAGFGVGEWTSGGYRSAAANDIAATLRECWNAALETAVECVDDLDDPYAGPPLPGVIKYAVRAKKV